MTTLISIVLLTGKTRSTKSDLILEELKKDASSQELTTEYFAKMGESNRVLHLKFQGDPADTQKKLLELCKKYNWGASPGTDMLSCTSNDPGVYDWIYWDVNVKTVTTWDPSFKSSPGIHFRRSRLQEITDYLRSFVSR